MFLMYNNCLCISLHLQDGGVEVSGSPTEKAILSWAVKVVFTGVLS